MATAANRLDDLVEGPLVPLRCRGCRQQIGLGTGPPGVRIYCNPRCAYQGPIPDNCERNHLIRHTVAAGWTTAKTAEKFGISRQRVNQMLYGKS